MKKYNWMVFAFVVFVSLQPCFAEEYLRTDDPRCQFRYSFGNGFTGADMLTLLKKGKITKQEYDRQDQEVSSWFRYIFNNSPYEMKRIPTPKFILGRLNPFAGKDQKGADRGIPLKDVFSFNAGEGAVNVLFPKKKSVPCGWVIIFFSKWKVDPQGYLEIYDPRFVPSKMNQ